MRRLAFRAAPHPAGGRSTRVGEPHCAQNRCRACQSISERASARIAASPPGSSGARRARVERLAARAVPISAPAGIDREIAAGRRRGREKSGSRRARSPRATARPVCQSSAGRVAAAGQAAADRAAAGCRAAGSPSSAAIQAVSRRRSLARSSGLPRKAVDLFHRAARLVASRSRRNCAGCPATPIRPSRCACRARCHGSS